MVMEVIALAMFSMVQDMASLLRMAVKGLILELKEQEVQPPGILQTQTQYFMLMR